MKKKLFASLALVPLVLTACGQEVKHIDELERTETTSAEETTAEETSSEEAEDGVTTLVTSNTFSDVEMKLEHEGDQVMTLIQNSTIKKGDLDEEVLNSIRQLGEETKQKMAELEGGEYSFTEEDDVFVEHIVMPLDSPENVRTAIENGVLPVTGDEDAVAFISLQQTKGALLASGWNLK